MGSVPSCVPLSGEPSNVGIQKALIAGSNCQPSDLVQKDPAMTELSVVDTHLHVWGPGQLKCRWLDYAAERFLDRNRWD